jgi:hypothetical protein
MIGLATPFRINNYGTKLQAYAVQEVVKGYGQTVEVIDYSAARDFRVRVLSRKLFSWEKVRSQLASRKKAAEYRRIQGLEDSIAKRNAAINSFDRSYLQLTPKIQGFKNLRDRSRQYKAVICGSDQIWGPLSTHTEFFTLEFAAPGVRRVAYAPSFGISAIPSGLRSRYRDFLRTIDHLSVRENQGQTIIKDVAGIDVPVVLDPTLLLSPAKWQQTVENHTTPVKGDYIFCYFLGKNPNHRRAVREIGRLSGLTIVGLPHFEEMVPEDETMADTPLYDVNPVDFLSLIKNASLVCTDSFHGTVFSTIFNKQFITFERFAASDSASTNSRIHSLLANLGLGGRLAGTDTDLEKLLKTSIDYPPVVEKLDALRRNSAGFLENALSGIL